MSSKRKIGYSTLRAGQRGRFAPTGIRGNKVTHSLFTPAERRNWGFWDGRYDAARGKAAEWTSASVYRRKHPFDQVYGVAYWQGFYGEVHPNTGEDHGQPK